MKQFLILLFFLSTNFTFSQDIEKQSFFNDILNDKIHYIHKNSSVKKQLSEQVIKLVNAKTLVSKSFFSDEKLELTDSEIDYLIQKINKNTNLKSKKYLKSNDKIKMYSLIKPKKGNYISFFSNPVLFRNNTLCIIYKESYKGPENAAGGWTLYRKENNKWKFGFSITEWIS